MDITTQLQLDMRVLRAIIAKALQLPKEQVRDKYQAATTGNAAFLTAKESTSTPVGERYHFDGAYEYITTAYETDVPVNAFGKNAYAVILKLRAALQTTEIFQALKQKGIGIYRISPARDLSAQVGGGYEERGQINIYLSHVHRIKTEMGRAETVEIKAITEDQQ